MNHSEILRFNWQTVVSEMNQMTSLLVECKIALYMMNRLRAYIEFLRQLSTTLTRINFEMIMTELYAYVLEFLTRVIRIYQTFTSYRALRAF